MGQGFFSDFFRILFGISRRFRHLGKSIVTPVTFQRFRGLRDTLLPNRMKYYSIANWRYACILDVSQLIYIDA